jgi:thioredoxin-dependent peroxiredoxin
MKRSSTNMLATALATCLLLSLGTASAAELAVGDPAPDFELAASDGNVYRLSELEGQAVILAWFPRAYTRGCTIECKSLAENGHLLREFDVQYFMASVDPIDRNTRFAADTGADFPLLSDEDKHAAEAYGVLNEFGVASRHTFYIGADGTILAIDRNVRPSTAAEDMAATLAELGVTRKEPALARD